MNKIVLTILIISIGISLNACDGLEDGDELTATRDDGNWFVLRDDDIRQGKHHLKHREIFGKYIAGYNLKILEGIDIVQKTASNGGGYFAGIKANPPEAPVGYPLKIFDKVLFEPQRKTSYCSGASYAAFIEGLNLLFDPVKPNLNYPQYEALRMAEIDGSRREDTIKFWGKWNDDGYGNHFALVQYSGMAKRIKPVNARPGDFINISWNHGGGHSTIFLGWYMDKEGDKKLLYWSSQTRTNGFGDDLVSLQDIKEVLIVRLINPANIFSFDINTKIDRKISGDQINW